MDGSIVDLDVRILRGMVKSALRYARSREQYLHLARSEKVLPDWQKRDVRCAREANHRMLRELRNIERLIRVVSAR